jgi:predicted nucleotide-binding protein (sugar kinase/HSP70/actin superfamily)
MRIGIPEALLFYRYEDFIRTFFSNLDIETVYSQPTNPDILERGIKECVDEACLPIKIFAGHVSKLLEDCDKVVVPRLMKCQNGDSICPKFAGLPELAGRVGHDQRFIFTDPLYLNDSKKFKQALIREGEKMEVAKDEVMGAYDRVEKIIREAKITGNLNRFPRRWREISDSSNAGVRIGVLGHSYNIHDSFANMSLMKKLKDLGVKVTTGEDITLEEINPHMRGLLKTPYWMFYRENLGRACQLVKEREVDGIIYISSFCCGTDSITIEMIKSKIGDFPMLVLKLDEHTAEAGIDTRLEAFVELLERRN